MSSAIGSLSGDPATLGANDADDPTWAQFDDEITDEVPKDPWFNPYRKPASDRARAVVDDVTYQLQALERFHKMRQRARRAPDQERFEATVSAVVCDAIHHHLRGNPGGGLVVSRSKGVLSKASRYRPRVFSEHFITVLDLMCEREMAFLTQTKGRPLAYRRPGRRTTIKAGSSLVNRIEDYSLTFADLTESDEEEVIVLTKRKGSERDAEKIEYNDTEDTRRYRQQVTAINEWLRAANITFDSDAAQQAVKAHGLDSWVGRFGATATTPVDTTERTLRRYFSNGSFKLGGRLFGGFWQQLHKQVRNAAVRIDGEPVVTLDYTAMNPMLAYAMVGEKPTAGDPYTLPGLEAHRDGVKQLFNALLFDTTVRKRFPKGVKDKFAPRVKVDQVIDAIIRKHPKLTGLFGTGSGHKIMFVESQIMERVLLTLREQQVVGLPVFDAVVVKSSDADKAEAVMLEAFTAISGLSTSVKREPPP